MFIGILSGLLAGAFWGFSFLVPKVLGNFSPSEVALGRFGFYGIVSSIFLIFHNKNSLKLFKKPYIRKAFVLCLTGNTLYYFLLIYCIRFAGIPYASLCIGMIPVTTVLFSGEKNVRKLLFPLALIV
jgi:drug/metabolite transporter (DMT)-like permease